MKNIKLNFLPERELKPRTCGLTMVMDKGLSSSEAKSLCEVAAHLIDYVKLGFGTSVFSAGLAKKVKIYKDAGIRVYLGGTLLEACYIRSQMDNYFRFAESLGLDTVEVSDGSMIMVHGEKCALIDQLRKKYNVLSEVGSKVAGNEIPAQQWVSMMQQELKAGSSLVIAEAREGGNVGIFDHDGCAKTEMIRLIDEHVGCQNILWEAPQKSQQAWFIKNFGAQVNLGNVAYNEAIALETLRCGLRGDTFGLFLPEELKQKVQK